VLAPARACVFFQDGTVVGTGETGNGKGVALDSGDIVIAR
jgi:DNA repair ATPase RecN